MSPRSSLEDNFHDISNEADEIVELILNTNMADQASLAAQATKKILSVHSDEYEEEFKDLVLQELPDSDLREMVDRAKTLKSELRTGLADADDISRMIITPELKQRAVNAKTGFISFMKDGVKELKLRENTPSQSSSANTSVCGGASNKTKMTRVEKYSGTTIGDIRQLIDQLDILAIDEPESKMEFMDLQNRVKISQTRALIVKATAKDLIGSALECDMSEESCKMEEELRALDLKLLTVDETVQRYKREYGAADGARNSDIKYPTFSGDKTEKHDFYSFKEDWDEYVAVKGPSKSEQLRILTRQCLTGTAFSSCRHMNSLNEVFEHL